MGTDAGPSPERFQGYFEHLEMEMMAEDGLSPARFYARPPVMPPGHSSWTTSARSNLGRGAISSCSIAIPQDIRNTRTISGVWIAGNAVKR